MLVSVSSIHKSNLENTASLSAVPSGADRQNPLKPGMTWEKATKKRTTMSTSSKIKTTIHSSNDFDQMKLSPKRNGDNKAKPNSIFDHSFAPYTIACLISMTALVWAQQWSWVLVPVIPPLYILGTNVYGEFIDEAKAKSLGLYGTAAIPASLFAFFSYGFASLNQMLFARSFGALSLIMFALLIYLIATEKYREDPSSTRKH
ncbi:hypothetical protein HDU97_009645 [Phlyctochytrium planicorne]|nr:hypothetical protein HDU97_009645 [Phlyctochytrium planicorne]